MACASSSLRAIPSAGRNSWPSSLERGPFRKFEGEWRLTPLTPSACKIEFGLQYEFDSLLVGRIAGTVFDRITNTLVDAYVARARDVYGPPAAQPQ